MSLLDRILKDGQYDAFPNSGLRIGAYEALHTGMTRPVTPYYREWDKRMTAAMEDIRNGADPKEMLDKAASDLTRLMKPESSP
ncbi:hypothetical protein [Cohnella rhizosphaerae]|uniref:Uncharacterized protein n=1 Tax=Cohnella rhizosphaerae TaxID=1457232 RepID=A0A9X4QUD1_9BACL|nr:hypothetical protein [Cohnella rhizosphaerae]MDG0811288.1 hypothetical protein [Cohnella rhizosphaerae]